MIDRNLDAAQARADLCRFLAACYYEPMAAFAEEGLFQSMTQAAERCDPELAAHTRALGAAFNAEDLQDLLVDYTRLFIGPADALARPYGSVWLERERELMRASTMDVAERYRAGGFTLADDFHELPDHIAVELEFLYVLLVRENQACVAGDANAEHRARELWHGFLAEHLGRWVKPFAEACRSGATTRFYRELGSLTDLYVLRLGELRN